MTEEQLRKVVREEMNSSLSWFLGAIVAGAIAAQLIGWWLF